MNNSLCIRLGVPYMRATRQIPQHSRFLNTLAALDTSAATSSNRGPALQSRPTSIHLHIHRPNQILTSGLCLRHDHFRLGIHLSSRQQMEFAVKSFQRGLSQSGKLPDSDNVCSGVGLDLGLPADNEPRHTIVPARSGPPDSTAPFAQVDIQCITNGDPILEKKLKVLFLELDVWQQEGKKVPNPSLVKNDQWEQLLNLNTRSARQKYLSYLWGLEMKKLTRQRKKEVNKKVRDETQFNNENGHIQYGLNYNTIFMRIYDTTMNNHYNNKLIQAMQYGQKVVVDCGYDAHMTTREADNAAKQIMLLFSENRFHNDPYDVYLCNANHNSHTIKHLHNFIPTMYDENFPLHVTNKSYLELFPKEDIVYLTPHCREELKSYDHESVYVIGGIVDKVNQEPLSLAKAKREGLRMAKLPLDRYLDWGTGSGKSLTINQMIQILLEMKTSEDWVKALQFVPTRKINHEKRGEGIFKEKQMKQYRLKRDKLLY